MHGSLRRDPRAMTLFGNLMLGNHTCPLCNLLYSIDYIVVGHCRSLYVAVGWRAPSICSSISSIRGRSNHMTFGRPE